MRENAFIHNRWKNIRDKYGFKKNGINILSVIIYWFQLIVSLINIAKMKSYRDETNQ